MCIKFLLKCGSNISNFFSFFSKFNKTTIKSLRYLGQENAYHYSMVYKLYLEEFLKNKGTGYKEERNFPALNSPEPVTLEGLAE